MKRGLHQNAFAVNHSGKDVLQRRCFMDNTTYRLVFQGKISEGEDVATVKERLNIK